MVGSDFGQPAFERRNLEQLMPLGDSTAMTALLDTAKAPFFDNVQFFDYDCSFRNFGQSFGPTFTTHQAASFQPVRILALWHMFPKWLSIKMVLAQVFCPKKISPIKFFFPHFGRVTVAVTWKTMHDRRWKMPVGRLAFTNTHLVRLPLFRRFFAYPSIFVQYLLLLR